MKDCVKHLFDPIDPAFKGIRVCDCGHTQYADCHLNLPIEIVVDRQMREMKRNTTQAEEDHCLNELRRTQNYISLSLLVDLMGDVTRGVDQYRDYSDLKQAMYVIRGEWFELRDEFETDPPKLDRIRNECLDLAATAIRLAEEIDRGSFQ